MSRSDVGRADVFSLIPAVILFSTAYGVQYWLLILLLLYCYTRARITNYGSVLTHAGPGSEAGRPSGGSRIEWMRSSCVQSRALLFLRSTNSIYLLYIHIRN